jgi:hypothetical protein
VNLRCFVKAHLIYFAGVKLALLYSSHVQYAHDFDKQNCTDVWGRFL